MFNKSIEIDENSEIIHGGCNSALGRKWSQFKGLLDILCIYITIKYFIFKTDLIT